MKGRNLLLAAPALLLAIACENPQQPDGVAVPHDPSHLISDGAHGGNPDFFFLPPMVSNPQNDPNFEVGAFNANLGPSLTVEVCELQSAPVDAQGLPVVTDCVAGQPIKKFAAGTIRLASPPDEFYQVLWHTSESTLDVAKYYRIKVLVEGASEPFGVADVDPVLNMKEFRNARTGEVIPLNDDATLPIKFRIEHGGGPALCGSAALCTSTTVTNTSSSGAQSVVVDAGGGSIAGATFPNGWLPTNGPQSVVVTIAEVNVGQPTGDGGPIVCHPGLPFQQFKGCFNYSTTPTLQPINEAGDQFAQPVTVAVCFELEGSGDPREKFAELYASGPNEPAHALQDVPDGGLLGVTTRDCSAAPVIAQSSNRLMQLASAGWRKMKGGLGQFFGVKTAYAVDLGLGGIVKGFSNISPVVPAQLSVEGPTDLGAQPAGTAYILNMMVTGSNHHADHAIQGIGGIPVTFSVASTSQGTVAPHLTAVGTVTPTSVESITRNDIETRGEASALWNLPATPGTYTLTVTGPATGGPVTLTATVNEVWNVIESGGWNAQWTRRGSTGVFDGVWVPATGAGQTIAVMDYTRVGNRVHFQRTSSSDGRLCTYDGTVAADGLSASGTETCPGITTVFAWTAMIVSPYPAPPAPTLNVLQGIWDDVPTTTNRRLELAVDGAGVVTVHGFGACVPTSCDWGTVTANTSQWDSNQTITAVFPDPVSTTINVTIVYVSATRLRVTYQFGSNQPFSDDFDLRN
jgi:hypothetical protein